MRSLRAASKRLQLIPTSLQVMWLPYLHIRSQNAAAREFH